MKATLTVIAISVLTACGSTRYETTVINNTTVIVAPPMPTTGGISIFPNTATVDASTVNEIVGVFEQYESFDASRLVISIDATARADWCNNQTDACTYPTGNDDYQTAHIYAPWYDASNPWSSAELIAHETCHAFYRITTGDGDSGHTHHECYARSNGDYAAYAGEIGIASLVADDFMSLQKSK